MTPCLGLLVSHHAICVIMCLLSTGFKWTFYVTAVDEVGEKLDIGDTPLEISTEVMEDKDSKEENGGEVIKVYIFKAEADDDLGNWLRV